MQRIVSSAAKAWIGLSLVALGMLVACGGGNHVPGGPGTPENAYQAEIRRTAMGVPHIKADNWKGLGYGYGYVQAQDNLCTLADAFVTYRGQRSKYFGATALPPASSTIGMPANLDSDLYHRLVISDDVIATMVAQQPPELIDLVSGFAAGFNRYLRDLSAMNTNANAACRNAVWVGPITASDVFRRMYSANLAGGYANFVSLIAEAQPPTATAGRAQHQQRQLTQLQQAMQSGQLSAANIKSPLLQVGGKNGVGSNVLAFGSASTDNGSPLLFGNPHWYWRGADRFYQAQLTIPGLLNVSGASFLGLPVILIGFNDNVAWSHTVSAARRFGIYQLTLANNSSTSYVRDGKTVAMTPVPITVDVKQADGSVTQVTRTLYRSEYGPILDMSQLNPALAWSGTTAFAIRDINAGNFRSFQNWLAWDRAQSLDEFITLQKQLAATPWVNTAAVGKGSSQAWYADIGAIPNVTDAQFASCTTPVGSMFATALAGVPFFDGSTSSCDWQTSSDSVQSGALGLSHMPSLSRSDYVANMNDSYWSTNPNALLTGYPLIMGPAGTQSLTLRTRLGHMLAQGRLAGTDGYAGNQASSSIVQQMVLNNRVLSAELFKTQALPLLCANPTISVSTDLETGATFTPVSVNVTQACAALTAWDNTGNPNSRGAHVWDEFWARASVLPESELYTTAFDATDPVHTPRNLNPAAATDLLQAFGMGTLVVQRSGFAENDVRSDYLFATRNGRKIGLFGGCDTSGYFTVNCSDNALDQGGYTMDNNPNGNSYMQVVSFPSTGTQAYTFLTFSLSDDPASPWYSNYTDRYAAMNWLRVPFAENEITSDAGYTTVTISE